MHITKYLTITGAAIVCVFSLILFLICKIGMGPSIAPVPKMNRFEARMPFLRDECVEVTTRPKGTIYIEEVACGMGEFANEIRRTVTAGKNIKAVVLIVGVNGDTDFALMKSALVSSVSQPTKLYYFHEISSILLEYVN
jgi:hypothetical protein